MTNSACGLLLIALLGSGSAAGAQLPPRVVLDQLLLRTERLIEADELDAAVEAMDEASVLAADHDLELPPDFRFEQAQTKFAVGLLGAAKESLTAHLTVSGREAESYLDAVGLLEDVDRILERRDAPECSRACRRVRRAGWNSPAITGATSGIPPRRLRRPRPGRASVRRVSPRVPGL